jgi:GNAT superfamily N-acetyltransferase
VSVLCRGAGRRDLDAVHALWLLAREYEHKADPRFETARDAGVVAREHHEMVLADPRTGFFVAEERGEVVAFLHAQIETAPLGYVPARYGEVVDLFVREDRRREQIASRLLAYCREWLEGQGVSEYRVPIPVQSEPAHRLFGNSGARPRTVSYSAEIETPAEEPESGSG